MMPIRLLLCLSFAFGVQTAEAKELGAFKVADASVTLDVSTVPTKDADSGIELNKMASLLVRVQDGQGEAVDTYKDLTFDARMPEHNHGMVVKPEVSKTAPGEFRVDGVKLHMAGLWELHFTLKDAADKTLIITEPLRL